MPSVLDIFDPYAMLFSCFGRKAEWLHIALFKFAGDLRGTAHFAYADKRESCWVAEEEDPTAARPLVKTD